MPNFEYTGVTAGIRDARMEARLEAISSDEADVIAGLAGLTDVGSDDDWDVTSDALYVSLQDEAHGFWKKIK